MQEKSEFISAVFDGETAEIDITEIERVVDDESARTTLTRYQLIGEALRGQDRDAARDFAGSDFVARVSAQIESEPTVFAPGRVSTKRKSETRFLKPVAGLAIAASVAAIALIGIPGLAPTTPEGPVGQASVASIDAAEKVLNRVAVVDVATPETAASTDTPELEIDLQEHQRRLNSYLVNFNEQRSNLGVPGVNPYVRIVGFESE